MDVALLKAYPVLWLAVIAFVVLVAWIAYGLLAVRGIEEPAYTVVETRSGYEVRRYAPHIVAETVVEGAYRAAMNEGFQRLAGYIFGGNTKRESVPMTAPVGMSGETIKMTVPVAERESIDMTAPVMEESLSGARRVSFVMPSAYTLETLPIPTDTRVTLRAVPERLVAARRFSTGMREEEITALKQAFLTDVSRDGFTALDAPEAAYYNPPWTPPFLRRNELLVPVSR